MKADQELAVNEGAGGFIAAADLLWVIQAIGATAAFLYVAWLCYSAYDEYGSGYISSGDMVAVWARSVFVLMVLLYLIAS
jgi:integrating conjugative element protein (TIGR03758 family)